MEHLERLCRLGLRGEGPLLDRTGFDELVALRDDRWRDDQYAVGLIDGCFLATWISGWVRDGETDESRLPPTQDEPPFEELLEVLDDIGVVRRHTNDILAMADQGDTKDYDRHLDVAMISYRRISHDVVFEKLVEFGYAKG